MLNTWETQEMWHGSQLDAGGGVQALMRAGESSRSRINAHLTDGQHLARGFAALRTSLNQLLSPMFTLPISGAWSSPSISTLHLIKNKRSTH